MSDQSKDLKEIETHLKNASTELSIALAKLGSLRGFVPGWIGWLSEYKRLVGLLLKLQVIQKRANYAVSRNPIQDNP